MPSYVVTGVSRGIGYAFLRQLSSDPKNTVIGIVRNKAGTEQKIAADEDLKTRTNIHILQASLTGPGSYESLKKAVEDTSAITGGALDFLIANAGHYSWVEAAFGFKGLSENPNELEALLLDMLHVNCIGQIHLLNLFMPLVLRGRGKKIVAISSSLGDTELVNIMEHPAQPAYSISKAALNMAIAKFSAEYKKEGVLIMAICPGLVDVGKFDDMPPEDVQQFMAMLMSKLADIAPDFKGPATPESAVRDVLSVMEKASIEGGSSGSFVSHHGNKQWL